MNPQLYHESSSMTVSHRIMYSASNNNVDVPAIQCQNTVDRTIGRNFQVGAKNEHHTMINLT